MRLLRLPLLRKLPVVIIIEMVVLMLGLYFDWHWYLDRLHDGLCVHMRVMLDWNMDPYPAKEQPEKV